MSALLVNEVSAVRVRLFVPWVGAWVADVDLDIGSDKPMPKGKVVLAINDAKLVGTVDARASGRFGEKGSLRVVAGGAGWDKFPPEQTFHNDAGVKSNIVITSTASAVGESAVDASPVDLDVDYIRSSKLPAVRVLKDRAWYVDDKGITQVAERPTATMPDDYDLLMWDPYLRTAELAGESLLMPGTVLKDPRIGDDPHTATVRDVEHIFDANGVRITAMCMLGKKPAVDSSRLLGLLTTAIRELGGLEHLKVFRYRITKQGPDGRLFLQAIRKSAGVPDTLPITIFPGMAGDSADHVPGTECLAIFTEGEPSRPLIVAFDGQEPLVRRIFAKTFIILGDLTAMPLAHAVETLTGFASTSTFSTAIGIFGAAVAKFATALSSYVTAIQPVADPLNTVTPAMTAAASALGAAGTALGTASGIIIGTLGGIIAGLPTKKVLGT